MREIKFRGKSTVDGLWVFGYYAKLAGINLIINEHGNNPVHSWSVGQCIGLPDKNGNEIYEGDIIEHSRHSRPYSSKAKIKKVKCIVKWYSGKSSASPELNPAMNEDKSLFNDEPKFNGYPVDDTLPESRWGYNWSVFSGCEIIGNIHAQAYVDLHLDIQYA